MTNPQGVPGVTNTADFPTGPCWTLFYNRDGIACARSYYVRRLVEARTRLAADVPEAAITGAEYSEIPLGG